MASKYDILGEVDNRSDGVSVIVQTDIRTVDQFSNDILMNAPPASQIKSIDVYPTQFEGYVSFSITGSKNTDKQITEISPDIAVCDDCLEDLINDQARIDYPFVNCTNCGPRFTIIEGLPYDRPVTAMKKFVMCDNCYSEYHDIMDRRFHAQPIACNSCGPVYRYKDHFKHLDDFKQILTETALQIDKGKTVAVKGMGGYFLICDALNESAVSRLRHKKQRDSKPFAVMFRDLSEAERYCHINEAEANELKSWRRPIIILRQKMPVAYSVTRGLGTIGAILPYMPLHFLLFTRVATPALVYTSGNKSDEPIIIDDEQAEIHLFSVADSILSYNREIVNRTDDSVISVADNKTNLIRRSRGYVPRPVDLNFSSEGILALGAEMKNSFCIGKDHQAIMSQYIGDLKNHSAYAFFTDTIERFSTLFRFKPELIVCDTHPDYLSTQLAEKLSEELSIPLMKVQHHHAHIASCMAENGIDEEVIGICLDGTGYGSDMNIWGGEFLVADLKGFRRYTHFDYLPMPGGEKAIEEPWRMALSYIYKYISCNFDFNRIPAFRIIDSQKIATVKDMIAKEINSPVTSGAGRLFDGVAAMLGLCSVATFDSEGPLRLESAIEFGTDDYYPFNADGIIDFAETIKAVIEDIPRLKVSEISAKFHNTIAMVILEVALKIRKDTSLRKVVLSGGVFQNKYLLEKSLNLLNHHSFQVMTNHLVPANDGGISLGQIVIASKNKELCV